MIARLFVYIALAMVLAPGNAHATITIEITRGMENAMPIAVVPFAWAGSGEAPVDVGRIVADDLRRSGRFKPLAEEDLIARPHDGRQVDFRTWRTLGAETIVVGRTEQLKGDEYRVRFQLLDVLKGTQLTGYSIKGRGADLRRTAHQIADIIYEALTGVRGAFDTNIAYVLVKGDKPKERTFHLAVADSDGYGEQIIYRSNQPIMSPTWAPDGKRLAYVSFSSGRPEIFIQQLASGKIERLPSHKGLNNAPAWSPDGKHLALTLSKDGNAEIYLYELASKRLRRITRNYAIDTEPAWLPDGSGLLFTSDRGGTPQIYRVLLDNGNAGRTSRITFEGSYNARATVSYDGRYIAMVHRDRGKYRIGVLDSENGRFQVLTKSRLDESPSFAPNASMILYATEAKRRGVLAAVSVDGGAQQKLTVSEGDIREPVWSPFKQSSR